MHDGSGQQVGDLIARSAVEIQALADLAKLLRALRLRHARHSHDRKLTYREMAARTGWSQTAIAEYFTGKTLPPTDRFDALVTLLGATPAEQGSLADARDRVEEHRRNRQPVGTAPPAPGMKEPRELSATTGQLQGQPGGRQVEMRGLFRLLRDQVEVNAQHAVEIYTREVPEYRLVGTDGLIGMSDFAVFIRRRSLELAATELPLGDDDLSVIASVGRQRAELGLSVPSQQQVLGLHTTMMLREVHDAARPDQVNDLLRIVGWLGTQGIRARDAYLRGYIDGVSPARSLTTRTEFVTRALLADEPVDPLLDSGLDYRVSQRHLVSVLRFPKPAPSPAARAEALRALVGRRILVAWMAPDEFVLLTPDTGEPARARALDHVREAAAAIGRPCQIATIEGTLGCLADSLSWARETSRVAPLEDRPTRLHTVADLFVELSVADTPRIGAWLCAFAQPLATDPKLVRTLDAYYCSDMNRTVTAAALNIHPRTLDDRLQRVRLVTGVDPGSTRGVRLLSTVVALIRAQGWS